MSDKPEFYLISREQAKTVIRAYTAVQNGETGADLEQHLLQASAALQAVVRVPVVPAPSGDADALLEETWRQAAATQSTRSEQLTDAVAMLGSMGQQAYGLVNDVLRVSKKGEAELPAEVAQAAAGKLIEAMALLLCCWALAAHEIGQQSALEALKEELGPRYQEIVKAMAVVRAQYHRERRVPGVLAKAGK